MNYLSPNQGLPYILSLFLETWPREIPVQIEAILKELLGKYEDQDKQLLAQETQEALGKYLGKRCLHLKAPFEEIEFPLLKLIASQKLPEWREQIATLSTRLRTAQASGEVRWAAEIIKRFAPQIYERQLDQDNAQGTPGLPDTPPLSPLELLLAKKESFIVEIDNFIKKYEELMERYTDTVKQLEETQKESDRLGKLWKESEQQLFGKKAQINQVSQENKFLMDQKLRLEKQVALLSGKIAEEQQRADIRVHQIQKEAERKILEFKDNLWRRLAPDLEDFLKGGLGEDAYATQERGRSLYRRIMDILGILRDMQIAPPEKSREEV